MSAKNEMIETYITNIIAQLGDDPTREGMIKTPKRVREALEFLTHGYR